MDRNSTKAVVMLDVLGFGSAFRRLGLNAMSEVYERLLGFVDSQTGGLDIVPLPAGPGLITPAVGWFLPEHAYFSDTVLFWADYSPITLSRLAEVAGEAVCISIELGLPLRGAIAIGEAVMDNERKTYIGEPLIELAATEKAQEWIGVSFGPSLMMGSHAHGLFMHAFLPFKSHIKAGHEHLVPGLTLDWPRRWRESRTLNIIDTMHGLDADPQFRSYYENTRRFVAFSEANHDWFTRQTHLDFG
jgi:hypothetical protein